MIIYPSLDIYVVPCSKMNIYYVIINVLVLTEILTLESAITNPQIYAEVMMTLSVQSCYQAIE